MLTIILHVLVLGMGLMAFGALLVRPTLGRSSLYRSFLWFFGLFLSLVAWTWTYEMVKAKFLLLPPSALPGFLHLGSAASTAFLASLLVMSWVEGSKTMRVQIGVGGALLLSLSFGLAWFAVIPDPDAPQLFRIVSPWYELASACFIAAVTLGYLPGFRSPGPETGAERFLAHRLKGFTALSFPVIVGDMALAPLLPFRLYPLVLGWLSFLVLRELLTLGTATPAPTAAGFTSPSEWGLTPREAEVVLLLSEGLSNPDIAQRLFVSLPTVKTHVQNVMRKAGVSNRYSLIRASSIGRS